MNTLNATKLLKLDKKALLNSLLIERDINHETINDIMAEIEIKCLIFRS